jgi:hypothetical protein
MTLSRKGSRRIVVDGVSYRWVVAREEASLHLVVESSRQPARRLYVEFDLGTAVSPSLVRRLIVDGLARGWLPAERGPELRFGFSDDSLVPLNQWKASRRPG